MEQQSPDNSVAQMYRSCISLEQKLREEMKHKNFYEANVRAVRAQLRSAYEGLLFLDYDGAQVREPRHISVVTINISTTQHTCAL